MTTYTRDRHRHWRWSKCNGSWFVDEYDLNEGPGATGAIHSSLEISRKRDAMTFAAALNHAFAAGRLYEREQNKKNERGTQ